MIAAVIALELTVHVIEYRPLIGSPESKAQHFALRMAMTQAKGCMNRVD